MHCSCPVNSAPGIGPKKKKAKNADVDALDVDAAYPNRALVLKFKNPQHPDL